MPKGWRLQWTKLAFNLRPLAWITTIGGSWTGGFFAFECLHKPLQRVEQGLCRCCCRVYSWPSVVPWGFAECSEPGPNAPESYEVWTQRNSLDSGGCASTRSGRSSFALERASFEANRKSLELFGKSPHSGAAQVSCIYLPLASLPSLAHAVHFRACSLPCAPMTAGSRACHLIHLYPIMSCALLPCGSSCSSRRSQVQGELALECSCLASPEPSICLVLVQWWSRILSCTACRTVVCFFVHEESRGMPWQGREVL